MKNSKRIKILYWLPRIIGIVAICFVMLFSFDVFEEDYTFGEQILALLMHNTPAFILAALLIVSWKWELIGGILFIAVSMFSMALFTHFFRDNYYSLIVTAPFLLTGILFIAHYHWHKKLN